MRFDELLQELQIPMVQVEPEEWLHNHDAPTSDAEFGWDPSQQRWCVYARVPKSVEEVLHEACHLLCGPLSVKEAEGDLMVFQWAVMQLLDPEPYRRCRDGFADYCWDWTNSISSDVGDDDAVLLADPAWQEILKTLIARGWISEEGKPLLRGPHPDWDPKEHVWLD